MTAEERVESFRPDADAPPADVLYRGGPGGLRPRGPSVGNLGVAGKQFWLGPARAGVTHDVIHLTIAG